MALFDEEHESIPLGVNHRTHDLEFANLVAMNAHVYTNDDIGKDYRVLDINKWYKLVGQIAGVGSFAPVTVAESGDILAKGVSVSFGSVSTVLLRNIPAGSIITEVRVLVITAFNGTAPVITIGDSVDNDRLMDTSLLNLAEANTYITFPGFRYTGSTDINAYYTASGSTAGECKVFLFVN